MKTTFLTVLALIAFAGNSVLCRLALADGAIDPLSFTAIRLLSGVVMLFILLFFLGQSQAKPSTESGSWRAAFALFAYAGLFSYAYVTIDTATGALILFGVVQVSLLVFSLASGNRLKLLEWVGAALALGGFVYLVYPQLDTPSITGFGMMTLSGVAWAAYTVFGRDQQNALRATAYNFLRSLPMLLVLILVFVLWSVLFGGIVLEPILNPQGAVLAIASGALSSGVGYAIWYAALKNLSTTQAGASMITVPLIAALGGAVFAGEPISLRLTISSVIVLGGIAILTFAKPKAPTARS